MELIVPEALVSDSGAKGVQDQDWDQNDHDVQLRVEAKGTHHVMWDRGRSCKSIDKEELSVDEPEKVHRDESEPEALEAIRFLVLLSPFIELVVVNLHVEGDREGDAKEGVRDKQDYAERDE